eukprot:9640267-Alexandrium_andersonii.AAC.1
MEQALRASAMEAEELQGAAVSHQGRAGDLAEEGVAAVPVKAVPCAPRVEAPVSYTHLTLPTICSV